MAYTTVVIAVADATDAMLLMLLLGYY